MIITLDVSAAVELVMGRPREQAVASLLEKADWVLAPQLYIFETANVMWKYHRLCHLPVEELLQKARCLYKLVDEYIEADDIYEEAVSLSCELNQPVYDIVYLVVSRRKSAQLLTLDSRLTETAKKAGISVAGLEQLF